MSASGMLGSGRHPTVNGINTRDHRIKGPDMTVAQEMRELADWINGIVPPFLVHLPSRERELIVIALREAAFRLEGRATTDSEEYRQELIAAWQAPIPEPKT